MLMDQHWHDIVGYAGCTLCRLGWRSFALKMKINRLPRLAIAVPALCTLLIALIWIMVSAKAERERRLAEAGATHHAQGLARSYAEQLQRTVSEINQITLTLKYYWENSGERPSLEDQASHGLYPPSSQLYVVVFDRNGRNLSSTMPDPSSRIVADREYFKAHLGPEDAGLFVSRPYVSRSFGRTVIGFSRALRNRNGDFNGVILVAVEPSVLVSFFAQSSLSGQDLIALHRADGVLISTRTGDDAKQSGALFSAMPRLDGESGVQSAGAGQFTDGAARVLAWQRVADYPLLATVGLATGNIYSAAQEAAKTDRRYAVILTAVLIISGIAGAMASLRAAAHARREARIKDTYRLATDGAREGFFMVRSQTDGQGQIVDFQVEDCNERGAAFVGHARAALIGTSFSQLYRGAALAKVMRIFRHAMENGFHEDEFKISGVGRDRPLWLQRKLVRSEDALAMTVRDISDSRAHAEQLSRMANEDALTTLHNRHWLMQAMPHMLARAQADGGMLALLFFDLDDFKNINNTLGHAAGDELLRTTALRLRAALRPGDHGVRLGGDEFTVILENISSAAQVEAIASRVVEALATPFVLADGSRHAVHASIGISMYPNDGEDAETLIKHADIAMYAVKAGGKGHFRFYHADLSASLVQRLALEQALRDAIERDQFVVHYQPRVDTFTGALRSMEALVRWQHPQRGLVPPLEFIPVAESMGLILALGQQVADKVCAQLGAWQRLGLPPLPVSINVSAQQFNQGDVAAMLADCMARHGIAAALLEVELTESCMLATDRPVAEQLAAIKALGVRLLVDDFGTGYSSLSQLQQLDLDVLKVDRAFTSQLSRGAQSVAFFRAIVSMAHVLDMSVVAEGVETEDELRLLRELACDEVQGYYISRPLPPDAMESLMRSAAAQA
jgi:diguanylate cyclase (GGDEF)-like protein